MVGQGAKILFHLLSVHTAVDIHNKRLVLPGGVEDLNQSFLPCVMALVFFERFTGVFYASPFHKVIDILEVIVKGHPVDPAVLCDVIDGDFIQRLLEQQVFQGLFQRSFCNLRHILSPFFSSSGFLVQCPLCLPDSTHRRKSSNGCRFSLWQIYELYLITPSVPLHLDKLQFYTMEKLSWAAGRSKEPVTLDGLLLVVL